MYSLCFGSCLSDSICILISLVRFGLLLSTMSLMLSSILLSLLLLLPRLSPSIRIENPNTARMFVHHLYCLRSVFVVDNKLHIYGISNRQQINTLAFAEHKHTHTCCTVEQIDLFIYKLHSPTVNKSIKSTEETI